MVTPPNATTFDHSICLLSCVAEPTSWQLKTEREDPGCASPQSETSEYKLHCATRAWVPERSRYLMFGAKRVYQIVVERQFGPGCL